MITLSGDDKSLLKLTMFREDASGGIIGMRAVGHVIINRAIKQKQSVYSICTKPWQFSSINCPAGKLEGAMQPGTDAEAEIVRLKNRVNSILSFQHILSVWPDEKDPLWLQLDGIADAIASGIDPDITQGATMYYATSMKSPSDWDFSKLVYTGTIGSQKYYREL